jgi:hypothetical protein
VSLVNSKRNSAYWRVRADEARAWAEEMVSPKGEEWMLEIARIYDKLADFAAKLEAAAPKEP